MSLYNLRTIPTGYTITKFDSDLNVESSYGMGPSGTVCTCPRANSLTCRHRKMFYELQLRVDTAWMLDFDTGRWLDPTGAYAPGIEEETEASPNITATEIEQAIANYKGPIPGDAILEAMVEETVKLAEKVLAKPQAEIPIKRRI